MSALAGPEPDPSERANGAAAYIGGALTTLHHLNLVSDAERKQWWDRLMGELPPGDWVEVDVDDP